MQNNSQWLRRRSSRIVHAANEIAYRWGEGIEVQLKVQLCRHWRKVILVIAEPYYGALSNSPFTLLAFLTTKAAQEVKYLGYMYYHSSCQYRSAQTMANIQPFCGFIFLSMQ